MRCSGSLFIVQHLKKPEELVIKQRTNVPAGVPNDNEPIFEMSFAISVQTMIFHRFP